MTQLPLVYQQLQEIVAGKRVQTSEFRGQLYYSPLKAPEIWVHRGKLRFTVDLPYVGGSVSDASGVADVYPFQLASNFDLAERHIRFFAKSPPFRDWMFGFITVGTRRRSSAELMRWQYEAKNMLLPSYLCTSKD